LLGTPKKWKEFAEKLNLPDGHDFHIQNYFITYRVHLRTSSKWVTIVDRGHLTSLDDPDVRTVAAKFGDADKLLSEDWIPDIPGINVAGSYEEYARDPWKYANARMQKILAGDFGFDLPKK
jgi:hypothetical protein